MASNVMKSVVIWVILISFFTGGLSSSNNECICKLMAGSEKENHRPLSPSKCSHHECCCNESIKVVKSCKMPCSEKDMQRNTCYLVPKIEISSLLYHLVMWSKKPIYDLSIIGLTNKKIFSIEEVPSLPIYLRNLSILC
jgi:hypothetical protein